MTIGERIAEERKKKGMTQEDMAEKLNLSRQAISKWETGQSEPTASNLIQLAEILELNLSELVDPQKNNEEPSTSENERHKKEPNLILRANLTKIAIIAHAAILFNCTSVFYQLRHPDPDYPNQELYMGALIFSLILLALSSIWMATNHRYETDKNQRRKNVNIELGYCFIQLLVGLLTIQFGLGLVGAAMIIAVTSVYILYINPKFMSRKLTK